MVGTAVDRAKSTVKFFEAAALVEYRIGTISSMRGKG